MLNRLFIAIGVLVILAIGAAFVVPRFIQWGDYRGRLETLASDAVGAPVKIEGDIQFSLLPQPILQFADVVVGDSAAPAIKVGRVEAHFSLLDFLRDQYRVTQLELTAPEVELSISAEGQLVSSIALADAAAASNISIAEADVSGGVLRVRDQRSDQRQEITAINGEIRLETLRGPFSFQGTSVYGATAFGLRVSSGRADSAGATPLSVFVKASDDSFTLSAEGGVTTAEGPRFAGTVTYRQPPPKPAEGVIADAGRGDLVLEGKLAADASHVLLSEYTLSPDENRPGTRLTGAAEIALGAKPAFNIVASGGVIALPPRDATAELTDPPYELVRLLAELPQPPIPGMTGKLAMDIAELNLRGVSLRSVRVDAHSSGDFWQVDRAVGTLPGDTRIEVSGTLGAAEGKPSFNGRIDARSGRLDALATLWRKPAPGNPLFNQAGALAGDLLLSGDTLSMAKASLTVGDLTREVSIAIGFAPAARHLDVDAHFDSLSAEEGALLVALLPDAAGSASFGATFPKGDVSLGLARGMIAGLDARDVSLDANWDGGVLDVTRLAAADLGGLQIDTAFTAFGTLAKPELSGQGTLKIAQADAAALDLLFKTLGTPQGVEDTLRRQLPANVTLQLDPPTGEGAQALSATGTLGAAQLALDVKFGAGVISALQAPLAGKVELTAAPPHLLTAQLGLGDQPLFPEDKPLHFVAQVDGAPTNSVEAVMRLEGGGDLLSFAGNIVATDPARLTGKGAAGARLSAPAAMLAAIGAHGLYLPSLDGTATLDFAGAESIRLSGITGKAGGTDIKGDLALVSDAQGANVTGSLSVAELDAQALLPLLTGSVTAGADVWPTDPIKIGSAPRTTSGRIAVDVASIVASGAPLLRDGRFDFDWDKQSQRIRGLEGNIGEGRLSFDATICCSGPLPDKRLNGRLSLTGVALDAVLPAHAGAALDGTLDASAQFDGTGTSLAAIMTAMTGNGSYSVHDFKVEHFDPNAFAAAGGIENVVDMEPAALVNALTDAVSAGPFTSPVFTGSFTIAGGVLRNPNLAIDGPAARIFGGGSVRLPDLTLSGRYTMTPVAIVAAATGIDAATAEIAIDVSGPVWAPVVTLDVATLADGMKIKASEIELARLEQLRAEEEERQKAAAAERARVAAEQAAAAEAARKAAEEEAARRAAEEAASNPPPPPPPVDIGI
ncbi:MAG TPA: AsmA family protein [Devosia sp.]|nr:AsmA family protein [Devosia sp.]